MPPDEEDVEDISPHVRIRIDPGKKKDWMEYAEKHHHGNLTDLIKHAVDNTIDDTWVLESDQRQTTEVDLEPIQQELSELKDDVSYIQKTVEQLERPSGGESERLDRDETLDLATQLHDMIPDVPRDEEPPPMDPDQLDEHERTGLPSELADELDLSGHQVRQALIELQSSLSNIKTRQKGDKRQWYEETP